MTGVDQSTELPMCPVCAAAPDRCDCFVDVIEPTAADRSLMAALALEHAGEEQLAQLVRAWGRLAPESRRAICELIESIDDGSDVGGGE